MNKSPVPGSGAPTQDVYSRVKSFVDTRLLGDEFCR